jgi:hypothetical protein
MEICMTYSFESDQIQQTSDAEGQNWIFASLFNLIVVADSLEQELRCQEIVRLVTEKFPCRVFLIQTDETSESDFFHVENSIQSIGTGSSRVSYDQITIESSPGQLRKAPFVILPKILPDLPVYILLGHEPTEDHVLLPELQKFATRIVFDSQSMDTIQLFSERMLKMMETSHNDFVDINFAKTKAWREILARVFDDSEKLQSLNDAKHIQITYATSSQTQVKRELQALYLQAWLAAQLGWTFLSVQKEDGTFRIQYQKDQSPIEIAIIAKDTELLDTGALFSIEILTHGDSHFLISHEQLHNQVTVHASSIERCEMPYSLFVNNYQKGTALINEALYQPPSEHYTPILKMLKESAWKAIQL